MAVSTGIARAVYMDVERAISMAVDMAAVMAIKLYDYDQRIRMPP